MSLSPQQDTRAQVSTGSDSTSSRALELLEISCCAAAGGGEMEKSERGGRASQMILPGPHRAASAHAQADRKLLQSAAPPPQRSSVPVPSRSPLGEGQRSCFTLVKHTHHRRLTG